jgi:hypothetical protein
VDEEVRPRFTHGLVDAHAADGRVDAPALAGGVAGPQEAHIAALRRRRAELARHRLAARPLGVQVLEVRAHEDVRVGRQAGEVDARGEVAGLERVRAPQNGAAGEALVARPFDDETRGAIRAAPDDGAIVDDVADLQTPLRDRTRSVRRHDRRGGARFQNAGKTGGQRDAGGRRLFEKFTTRQFGAIGLAGHASGSCCSRAHALSASCVKSMCRLD